MKDSKRTPARRAASIKGLTHQRLKNYAESEGRSISSILEKWIDADMDAKGVPVPEVEDCPKRPESHRKRSREIFTF